jgi:transcriptional regulator with XRE-family HTH domain
MYRDDLLRARAAAERLTVLDLEKLTGISRTTVAKILNGDQTGRFELHRLHAIAKTLGVPMPQLFEKVPAIEQAANLLSAS